MAKCGGDGKARSELEQQTILRDMAKAWQQLGEKIEKDGNGPGAVAKSDESGVANCGLHQ